MSRFMARIFIRPVEKAWSQQQNFIADASHELKTPLTVILANTNILQEHKADTINNQYKWIESTQVEANHMKELVDKMLILAKSDNMKVNNMFSDVDMSELATRLCLQFEPIAFENGGYAKPADGGQNINDGEIGKETQASSLPHSKTPKNRGTTAVV